MNANINLTEAIKSGILTFEQALALAGIANETSMETDTDNSKQHEEQKPEAKKQAPKQHKRDIFKHERDSVLDGQSAKQTKRAAQKKLKEQGCNADIIERGSWLWIEKPDDMTLEQFAALKLSKRWQWAKSRIKHDKTPAYYCKFEAQDK